MKQMRCCWILLLLSGCLPESEVTPIGPQPPPASCGNGICELALTETCENCPADCPCCTAVYATGIQVEEPLLATGLADGRSARMISTQDDRAVLELTLGKEIFEDGGQDGGIRTITDFELIGQVSGDPQPHPEGCPIIENLRGSVLINVWTGSAWEMAGLWPGGSSGRFGVDLFCASVRRTDRIQLVAQPDVTVQVDALEAISCTP